MPNRKLFDIAPPKQRRKEEPKQTAQKLRPARTRTQGFAFKGKKLPLFLGVVLFGVLGILLHVVFASATVSLELVSRELVLDETVVADPGTTIISPDKKTIPALLQEQEKSGTKFFPATGKQTQETKAEGTIRVFNNQAKTQILVATTRFVSEEGKLFRSKSRLSIAPNGSADVEVIAAEAGAEYNIGASNFSLPGLLGSSLYTVVYGKSFTQMQGGLKSEVMVVSEDDIRFAKEFYTKELLSQAKNELRNATDPLTLIEESLRDEVISMTSSVAQGAQVSQFNITGKVNMRGLAFSKDDLNNLVKELLMLSKESREMLDDRTLELTQKSASFSASTQKAALSLEIKGKVYQTADREEMASKLLGRSKAQAQQLLLDYPQLERFELSFFPFWKQTVPQARAKLNFDLVLPGD